MAAYDTKFWTFLIRRVAIEAASIPVAGGKVSRRVELTGTFCYYELVAPTGPNETYALNNYKLGPEISLTLPEIFIKQGIDKLTHQSALESLEQLFSTPFKSHVNLPSALDLLLHRVPPSEAGKLKGSLDT